MGLISTHGRTFVVLINTLFGLIGMFFLAAGGLVRFAPQYIDKYAGTLLKAVKEQVPEEITDHLEDNLEDFKISEFVGGAATAFLIIGGVLVAIVMWAYCGTCLKSKWMLVVYAMLLTTIILGEVAVAVLFTTNREMIDEKLKKPLQKSLSDFYEGSTSNSAISLAWNALMGLLKCCGVDGPGDFSGAKSWNTSDELPMTTMLPVNIKVPVICYKNETEGIEQLVTTGNITEEYVIQTGCYEAIWDVVKKNQTIAIAIVAGVGAFQVILWILTVCIIHEMGGGGKKVHPK